MRKDWKLFKMQYGKSYATSEEDQYRFKTFLERKHSIAEHNSRYEKGEVTYKKGLNKFSDMAPHELASRMNGCGSVNRTIFKKNIQPKKIHIRAKNATLPDRIDWREKGAVTPVKDQGACQASWAFSVTGALEGRYFLKKGDLKSFSEQNLIDCTSIYGNDGCCGGDIAISFYYVELQGGIDLEEDYPYTEEKGDCNYVENGAILTDSGYERVNPNDENALMSAVSEGPVSAVIHVNLDSFMDYQGGIYYEYEENEKDLFSEVLVVGYDSEDGNDFWIVKNSLGDQWGEEGYLKIARNKSNNCGIASEASFPLILD